MAREFNLQKDGYQIVKNIKRSKWFPFDTGNLKHNGVKGKMKNSRNFWIKYDSQRVKYIPFLENGTLPHDIPRAFGRPLPFGIGGRFEGKFHPGSFKHADFISENSIQEVLRFYVRNYNATMNK